MSRRLPADRLHPADVRPMRLPGGERTEIEERAPSQSELESLDLVNFGPYLLLLQAHESAEQLILGAQAEAEAIREQARLNGAVDAREEAKGEVLPAAVAFANAGQALIVFEQQMIARYTSEMVRLALEVAEKLVHKAVSAEPEIVAAVLQRAREEVTEARRVCIRLNPQDYELLAEIRPDLLTLGHEAGRMVEVLPDEDLTRGGCRLETEIGMIDAALPTQIAEVRRQLLDGESFGPSTGGVAKSPASAVISREL
ncbi:MAG TPA: FliH/SctL family protein [Candidatus Binatia bacterium]|nr:FliH/SctL family protein [Candidatus Binatia bacterium]